MIYIGIDPGVSGAVAVIDGDTVRLFDVPTRKATKGEAYLAGEMADLIRGLAGDTPHRSCFVVLEEAEAPRLGLQAKASGNTTAAVKIGRGIGLWEGIVAALGIPYEIERAGVWKRPFKLTAGDKTASRARACELFPAYRAELTKRRPDYSEALLLAEWGRRRKLGIAAVADRAAGA